MGKEKRGRAPSPPLAEDQGRKGGEGNGTEEDEELLELFIPTPRAIFREMQTTPAECLKLWLALIELGWRIDSYRQGHSAEAIAAVAGTLAASLLGTPPLSPHVVRVGDLWRLRVPPHRRLQR